MDCKIEKIKKPWGVCMDAYIVKVVSEYDDIVHIEFSDRCCAETWKSEHIERFEILEEAVERLVEVSGRTKERILERARYDFKF